MDAWSGASKCGQLVPGQLFSCPFLLSYFLMKSECFLLAKLCGAVRNWITVEQQLSAWSRWVSCGSYLLPGRQLIHSDRYGAALSTLFLSHFSLCCCYFAAAHLWEQPFTFSLWLPVVMKKNLVIKGTRLTISRGLTRGEMWELFLCRTRCDTPFWYRRYKYLLPFGAIRALMKWP